MQVYFFFPHDNNRNLRAHTGGRQKLRKRLGMDNGCPGLAIFEVMNVIGRTRERIYGNGHRADFCSAKEGGNKLRRIRQRNKNAIATGNALRAQRIASAISERGQFTVAYFAWFTNDGVAPRVQRGRGIHEVLGNIQLLWILTLREFVYGGSHCSRFETNSGLLSRGSRASDSNLVPRRAGGEERGSRFGIFLFAGAQGAWNCALIDQNGGIGGADVTGLIRDLALALCPGFIPH